MISKILLVFLFVVTLTINAYSQNSYYVAESNMFYIPIIELNDKPFLKDVELLLRDDGLLVPVSYTIYEQDKISYDGIETFKTFSTGFSLNDIYLTESNFLINIVGTSKPSYFCSGVTGTVLDAEYGYSGGTYTFSPTLNNLPAPEKHCGIKGSHYILAGGFIAYANILGQPGDIAFDITQKGGYYDANLVKDGIYETDTGDRVIVTAGIVKFNIIKDDTLTTCLQQGSTDCDYSTKDRFVRTFTFRRTPSYLPEPTSGYKGTYYTLDDQGSIAYVDFL